MNEPLATLLPALACTSCKGQLQKIATGLRCVSCEKTYVLHGAVPHFIPIEEKNIVACHTAPRTIPPLFRLFRAPHHSLSFRSLKPSIGVTPILASFLHSLPENARVLHLGTLTNTLNLPHLSIINLDIAPYAGVNIVADGHALPFQKETFDAVIANNVLEHVRDAKKVVAECVRALRSGGLFFVKMPFMQPFHAAPYDFERLTAHGLRELFSGLKPIEEGIAVGPGSMLSWTLREFFATLFSGGNAKLYRANLHLFGWLTFWLKYLDLLFWKNQFAENLASTFYGVFQKPHQHKN